MLNRRTVHYNYISKSNIVPCANELLGHDDERPIESVTRVIDKIYFKSPQVQPIF